MGDKWRLKTRPNCEHETHYSVHDTEEQARAKLGNLCQEWLLEYRFYADPVLVDWNDREAVILRCHEELMSADGGGYIITKGS